MSTTLASTATATATATAPAIVVTKHDLERLEGILRNQESSHAEKLLAELARAEVLSREALPADVVTMNSEVVYQDVTTQKERRVRLVYPKDADVDRGWISVLAPLGSALLGLRVGQAIDWDMPGGARRIRVVGVPYQPEASGDLSL